MTTELLNCDCMEYMATQEYNAFDLAVVDPPYGIGFDGESDLMAGNKCDKWKSAQPKGYARKSWDQATPDEEYFIELFRVSKHQIIWGGNYFDLPQSPGWIFWNKGTARNFTLSPGELAWSSFTRSVNMVEILWAGFRKCEQVDRIHPTQKPVKLYNWIYRNYAEKGQRILDTHLGSGSNAIAAHYAGMNFVGCEIDQEYFEAAQKRFNTVTQQLSLF